MDNVLITVSEVKKFLETTNPQNKIYLDTETSGLEPWRGHRIAGISICQNEGGVYIPLRMRMLGKQDDLFRVTVNAEEGVLNILRDRIPQYTLPHEYNEKFDRKMFKADGVELSYQGGCTYVKASLILAGKKAADGKKQRLKLKSIAKDILQLPIPEKDDLDEWFKANGMSKEKDRRYDYVPLEVIAPYAIADVTLLRQVDEWADKELDRWNLRNVYNLEMKATRVLMNMESEGVYVDTGHCERNKAELEQKITDLRKGLTFNPENDAEIVGALQAAGIELTVRTEPTKFHPDGEISVDKSVLKKIDNDIAKKVLEFRGYKSPLNFFDGILRNCDDKGYLHPSFQQFSSRESPGRTSSTDPNMQNFPRSKQWGVRASFVTPPGMKYCFGDFSQMHLRIASNQADEPAMQQGFLNGYDFHAYTASLIYGVAIDAVTPDQRRKAKDCNFCMLYGGGVAKLALTAGISEDEARSIYDRFHKAYSNLQPILKRMQKQAEQYGYMTSPSGRIRFLSDEFHRAFNTIILGIEADVTKNALVKLDQMSRSLGGRVVNFVHDEVQLYVPDTISDEKVYEMMMEVEDRTNKVPLTIDVSVASPSWAEKRDIKHMPKTIIDMRPKEDSVKVEDLITLKQVQDEKKMVKIKKPDGKFVYIAGTEDQKAMLMKGGREAYTVDEIAEMIVEVRNG